MSDCDSVSFTDGDKYGIVFATGTFLAFDQFNIIDNAIHISFSGISNLIYYWWFHCLSSFYINKEHRRKLLIKCIEKFCVSDIEKDLIRMRLKKPMSWFDPWWKQLAIWLYEEQKKIVAQHFLENPKHTEELAESTEHNNNNSNNNNDNDPNIKGGLLFEQHTANFMQELCLNQGVVFGTEGSMYCHSFSNFAPGQIHMMTNPQYVYVKIGIQKGKQIKYCVQWKNGEIAANGEENNHRYPLCSSSAADIIASLVCPVSICQSHFKLSNVPIIKIGDEQTTRTQEKQQRFYCPEIDNYLCINRDEAVFVPIWPIDPLNLLILRLYHIKRETIDKTVHRITSDNLDTMSQLRKRSREVEMDELSGSSLRMADEEELMENRLRRQYPNCFDIVDEEKPVVEEKKQQQQQQPKSYSPTNSLSTVTSFANVKKSSTDLDQYKNNKRTLYLVDIISSSHKIKSSTQKGVIEGVIANEKKIIKGTDEPNNEDVRCRLKQDVEMNLWLESLQEFVQDKKTNSYDEKENLLSSYSSENQMYLDLIEEIKQNDIRLSSMNPHSFHLLLCLGYISTLRTFFNLNFNIKNINYWFPNIECKQCFALFTEFSKSILSTRP